MAKIVEIGAGGGANRTARDAGGVDVGLEGIRALGFDHESYFYLSPITQQLVELAAEAHTEKNLYRLQDAEWWVENFPPTGAGRRQRFDVSRAADRLMAACHRVGPYDADLIRGRGVWWAETQGAAIVHDGQWVQCAGAAWRPSDAPFAEVYEAASTWRLLGPELEEEEPMALLRLLERMRWVLPVNARLLAGWLVVAPVCGALAWRPHIALTGPRESGKTWLVEQVIVPVLGPAALHALGETTSAGIRQELGRDARPIVWDEAEPQGRRGADRVQDAIALARHLSPNSGGAVIKGGSHHNATRFQGTAAMCIVSIFAAAMRDADASRFTVLELLTRVGHVDPVADAECLRLAERLTPAWARGLLARTVRLLPVLRASHAVFARALAERWGSVRLGDQLGALLTGAHLLGSEEPIALADAREQVAELPDELGHLPTGVSDEERCLQRLAAWWTRIDTAGGKRQVTRSVGELVALVIRNGGDPDDIEPGQASRVLLRHGVRVSAKRGEVTVAHHHDRLADIYGATDFAGGWARLLERLPGARKTTSSVRFGPGVQGRGTVVPAALFGPFGADPPPPPSAGASEPPASAGDSSPSRAGRVP